jgi:D-arginine dehydrogenase
VETVDVVVIGAGIAGLSAGAALAARASVTVVEAESTPAFHATGRSAALYLPTYGPATVRRLTAASADFFHSANEGRSEVPLVGPRPMMWVADDRNHDRLLTLMDGLGRAGGRLDVIDASECRVRCPALRDDWIVAGAVDHDALDIDVAATVATFRATLVDLGGRLRTDQRVTGLVRTADGWIVETTGGNVSTGIVVNAAGAWVDPIARLAGLEPLGFEPRRRTMGIGPTGGDSTAGDHFVAHADMDFYFRGEHGALMFSPADETPSEPTDARPEEIDVALAIDRINEATTFGLRSVRQSWAGLRTFGPDGGFVIGPDPSDESFVWCAGQGGYGIHTCAGAAMATAALATGDPLPGLLADTGLTAADLTPARLRQA